MGYNHLSPVSLVVTMVVLFFASQAHADIYKYVDKYGRVYLTDRPSHSGYKRIVRTWKGWTLPSGKGYADSGKNRRLYAPAIAQAALRYRLPHA